MKDKPKQPQKPQAVPSQPAARDATKPRPEATKKSEVKAGTPEKKPHEQPKKG